MEKRQKQIHERFSLLLPDPNKNIHGRMPKLESALRIAPHYPRFSCTVTRYNRDAGLYFTWHRVSWMSPVPGGMSMIR